MTETIPSDPPVERPDIDPMAADPALRTPLLTGLGAAASLLFGGVMMLGFAVTWALIFYPPASLAIGGAVVCAAFALAAFVQAVREFARAVHWRRRAV